MGKRKPRCFVICPLGERASAERKRSDIILKKVIVPVLREKGYARPTRADQIPRPGIITFHIIEELARADLVIADLTDGNPNVFYELAIRHVSRKPVVMIAKEGQRIPFDVSPARVIMFDASDDTSLESARREMRKQIDFSISGKRRTFNPVTVALDILTLETREGPREALARLMERLFDVAWETNSSLVDVGAEVESLGEEGQVIQGGLHDVLSRLDDLESMVAEGEGTEVIQRDLHGVVSRLDEFLLPFRQSGVQNILARLDDHESMMREERGTEVIREDLKTILSRLDDLESMIAQVDLR